VMPFPRVVGLLGEPKDSANRTPEHCRRQPPLPPDGRRLHGRIAARARWTTTVLFRIQKTKIYSTEHWRRAQGCERGVRVSLVGLHAPVTGRPAFSRGLCWSRHPGRRDRIRRRSGSRTGSPDRVWIAARAD
jgi:hypothetical protein